MSKFRVFLCRRAILSFVLFLVVGAIHAVPAIQTPITITQPDGSQLTILLRGDENFHFSLTPDGYLIQQNQSGYYVYSDIDANNAIEGSSMRVNNVAQRTTSEKSYLTTLPKDRILQALDSEIQLKSAAQSIRTKALKSQTKLGGFPTTGVVKSLVILVEFSDNSFTVANPTSAFYNLLNQEGYAENSATGSSKDYFIENSQGQFHPQFDVHGPVKLPQAMSYYGGNSNGSDKNPARMVVDACNLLKDSIDFSEYDIDKDGFVDNVYVFYAGYGEADGGPANTIWPHKYYVYRGAGITLKLNGVQVDDYACSSELINGRGTTMCGIGTFTHEFSHVLGLPDLYQTNGYSTSFTPGSWSILDYGPYNNGQKTPPNYSVYERYSLGWLNPVELDTIPADIVVDSIQNNVGYIIKTSKANEYFLLENRQKSGWDTYIPGHGMLVWHIDYNNAVWSANTVNNTPAHQYVDIIEADNIKTESTRAGDAFPGTSNVTSLTDSSTPNMKTWADVALDKPITDIKETAGKIYFKFRGGVSFQGVEAVADTATEITPVSFVANWKPVENATGYLLDVYEFVNDTTLKYVTGYNSKYVGNVVSYKVDNLTAETEYRYVVRATNGYTKSQTSNEIKVQLPEATFESYLPVASAPTAVSSTAFTANWEAVEGATSYILNVYKTVLGGTTSSAVVDFADKGNLPAGWTTDGTSFYSSTGYYGVDYPALRLEANGRYVESPIFDAPIRSLKFWYRGASSSSDNVLEVQGYTGNGWVVLKDIKSPTNGEDGEIVVFNEADLDEIYAIKIIFVKTGDGAIALDDINVTYGGDLTKEYLSGYTDLNVGNVLSYTVLGLENNTKYSYTVAASNGNLISRNSAAISVQTQNYMSSINDPEANKGTNVYVTTSDIVVKTDNSDSQVLQLFSVDGRLLLNGSLAGEAKISRDNIVNGIYLVKVGSKTYKVLLK